MSWNSLLIIWLFVAAYGMVNQSWRKQEKKETIVFFSLLGLALILSIGLGLNPHLPGLTEWVTFLYKPLQGWLSP